MLKLRKRNKKSSKYQFFFCDGYYFKGIPIVVSVIFLYKGNWVIRLLLLFSVTKIIIFHPLTMYILKVNM